MRVYFRSKGKQIYLGYEVLKAKSMTMKYSPDDGGDKSL
jgi:hypothetical protein